MRLLQRVFSFILSLCVSINVYAFDHDATRNSTPRGQALCSGVKRVLRYTGYACIATGTICSTVYYYMYPEHMLDDIYCIYTWYNQAHEVNYCLYPERVAQECESMGGYYDTIADYLSSAYHRLRRSFRSLEQQHNMTE